MALRNTMRFLLLCALALITAYSAPQRNAQNLERVIDYHSDITLQPDTSLLITETIKVYANGRQIQHGIYREFPTRYKDSFGNDYVVDFRVDSVALDGYPEPFHTQDYSNGVRLYAGDPKYFVSQGEHTYQLTYTTNRQLGFYKDHDGLFWNATGNGWAFPIEHASAVIHLPASVPADAVTLYGYTGSQGSHATDFTSSKSADGFEFTALHPLPTRHGLSIGLNFPKGYIAEPTAREKLFYFLRDNRGALILGVGFLFILLYYVIVWAAVGRDPAPGVIMPLYQPPSNLAPAAMRYLVRTGGFDNKTFTAAIIDMAVRGFLKIKFQAGSYTLYATGKPANILSPEEQQIAGELFDGRNEIWLHNENNKIIRAAIKAAKKALSSAETKVYFVTNSRYILFPFLLSLALVIFAFYTRGGAMVPMGIFVCIWLSIWTLAVFGMLTTVVKTWRTALRGQNAAIGIGKALFYSFSALPFLFGEGVGLFFLAKVGSLPLAIFIILAGGLHILFFHLLKAPTIAGRQLLDQVEGFKQFLGSVDQDRLNRAYPPEQTPEVFEKFLPYALALDVEQDWSEKFSGVLAMAGTAESSNAGVIYTPSFYSGMGAGDFTASSFTSSFSDSFAGAISSASTAPGSSGGAGGGGGSGGGGGGGGGGGW
jgi:uncharacterized membrane protein YgcG